MIEILDPIEPIQYYFQFHLIKKQFQTKSVGQQV